ncbi:MAG: NUDIX hydrolase [Bacteroidales bacterium]|nr:NUDIX hydrolase [Bacteroidales bacterium]
MNWKVGETKELIKTPIWTVCTTHKTDPAGRERDYVTLKSPDWVCAVVRLGAQSDRFVMVRQFRHGINKLTVEFPCGMVDGEETAKEALLRELDEEVGIKDANIVSAELLYEACPNPAFMNNRMSCYYLVVSGLGNSRPDEDEFLETVVMSAKEVDETVAAADYNVMMKHAWLLCKRFL